MRCRATGGGLRSPATGSVRRSRRRALLGVLALPVASSATEYEEPPTSFEPVLQAENFSITEQRQTIYDTPAYQAELAEQGAKNHLEATAEQAADPERFFTDDLCLKGGNGCAGDVRLYNWEKDGYGHVRKVLFTTRGGATLSGRDLGDGRRPEAHAPGRRHHRGSVQADEQMYWYAAQALAKDGYIVMTFDPQGQGQSDTLGQAPDEDEGFPAQTDGRPFYDGTEDALDFFLSTPKHPYEPVPSCETGTSHAAKQDERVKKGLDAAYNPFWKQLNAKQIGLAGHSYGAVGVSYIAQWDPRVKAVVALGQPRAARPRRRGSPRRCAAVRRRRSARRAAPRTRPTARSCRSPSPAWACLPTTVFRRPQHLTAESRAQVQESLAYSAAGVDSGEIIIRGGSHLDFSFIPNQAFGASLRGADEIAWYTSAWFDKYLKHEKAADKRLLTNRWREDPRRGRG